MIADWNLSCAVNATCGREMDNSLCPTASSLALIVAPRLTPQQLRLCSRHWMPLGKRVVVIGADLAAIELA